MKNAIIAVSILSAAIITTVLLLSSLNDESSFLYDEYDYEYTVSIPKIEFYIVTTTLNFWDKIASLNSTQASESVTIITDEEGNTVTDESGNPVTIIFTEQPTENEQPNVTDIPEELKKNSAEETSVPSAE